MFKLARACDEHMLTVIQMILAMHEMMVERLKLWHVRNGNQYPESIIVYRDGVSEGKAQLPFRPNNSQ